MLFRHRARTPWHAAGDGSIVSLVRTLRGPILGRIEIRSRIRGGIMKRRALAALAALALGAAALLGTPSAAVAAEPGGAPYVAVGDSIAAGTGNLPYTDASCLRG